MTMSSPIRRSLPALVLLCNATLSPAEPARLAIERGDHICLIGNTLAERFQYSGWLETILYSRFPAHDLVIRNLGFSGDELTLRLRSEAFGSPDDHLSFNQADVILAFFGFNESFAGEAGLARFRTDLEQTLRGLRGKKYNGETAPRLALISPIAHEDLRDPNLPTGSENNARLELYTDAMAEVASAEGVPFVDLFRPTLKLYREARKPLTINGIHLNEEGDRQVALAIDAALFPGQPAPGRDVAALEKLRAAVLDKCTHWFHRYRIVDGYSVFGGRSWLKFVDGQTNREVMDREFEVLDVMVANRDRRIWALAQGKDIAVDDANTPPFLEVKTNKPGAGPDGAHVFLGGKEAIGQMKVHRNMKINLFATEERFPDLAKPVQMAFDTKGRLWVAVMPSYPHWRPKDPMDDKLLILEDTDQDGEADRCIVFADKLHVPTGLELYGGGVLVGQQPCLMFLKDTDGDDRADVRERLLHGIDSADTHHALNSFVLDPGGALYFQEGTFHHTQVETIHGVRRCANAGVFRYEPRTHKFDVYISYGFANPHGHVFDRWGQDFVTDGTGNVNYFAAAFSGHLEFPHKHRGLNPFFNQRSRPCAGTAILSSTHFPEEMQGNYLICNVIGFQGIFHYRVEESGSGFTATEVEPIVESRDPSFRPADVEVGPDGAIYFLDWQNPIIGHMQHNLRDPSRDHHHGRVYRVTYEGRPLLQPRVIAGAPIESLVELLADPNDGVRYRAKIELSARPTADVIAAVRSWEARLDRAAPEYEHQRLEALWMHQYHNVVDEPRLDAVLASPDHRARAAATRVLCYWRDRVPSALDKLKRLAADPHPRVRLEAVRAASFFTVPYAVEVALTSMEHPTDYYLDYTRGETMRALEPYWRRALAEGRLPVQSRAVARFLLRSVGVDELLKGAASAEVHREILAHRGATEAHRKLALRELARLEGRGLVATILATLKDLDSLPPGEADAGLYDVARELVAQPALELATVRSDLEKLATAARTPVGRQVGYVALIAADQSPEPAWKLANAPPSRLLDLVSAFPLITDAGQRAALYPRIEPLAAAAPSGLTPAAGRPGALARFVRIELPRRGTLTLAEVEAYSGGENIAPRGKASQKNTAHGGDAARAIDRKTGGSYGDGGQTHTQEDTRDPWWELDLGEEQPIERLVVFNRTDGDLGRRLDGFTLRLLDASRQPVFSEEKIPGPAPRLERELAGSDPSVQLRRAAMMALTHVRGQEARAFALLARLAREGQERAGALRAIQRLPAAHWPREEAPALLASLLAYVESLPASERTSSVAIDALQVSETLASFLPAEASRSARARIGELGVRVIRLGAIPHEMLFDKDRLAVQAGKPVEVIFENADLMPHNFVVSQPGSLEEIGLAAEAMATQPGALERSYIPESGKIIVSSRLLQPRDVQRIAFTAPQDPGVYPYVCTFPGHWRRMFGALYVVKDLAAFQADEEGYLAASPLTIADKMLEVRRPRKEWKLEDLAGSLAELDMGRTFANSRNMFQVATCVACHRLGGQGNEFGPDLAQLDPKLTRVDILNELLDPSAKINEKFIATTVVTTGGRVITGLVLAEGADGIRIIENPLLSTVPLEIPATEIAQREKAEASLMPKGLLSTLSREEILDLLAYLEARGDPKHKVFQGGCGLHPAGK